MVNRQLRELVHQLVDWYASSDPKTGILSLNPKMIPEDDLNDIAGLILSQCDGTSSEANGADNDEWDKAMLPGLIRTMRTKKTAQSMEEFYDIWISGVRAYVMPTIESIIEEHLEELNEDKVCHTSLIWDRERERTVVVESIGSGRRYY